MKPPEMWSRNGHCDRCQVDTARIVFIELTFPRGLQVRLCEQCLTEALSLVAQKPHNKPSSPIKSSASIE